MLKLCKAYTLKIEVALIKDPGFCARDSWLDLKTQDPDQKLQTLQSGPWAKDYGILNMLPET